MTRRGRHSADDAVGEFGPEDSGARQREPHHVLVVLGELVLLGVLALLVVAVVHGVHTFTYRAGWSGVPGTVKVAGCDTTGSGRFTSYHCSGFFQPAHGPQGPETPIEGTSVSLDATDSLPARLWPGQQSISVATGGSAAMAAGQILSWLAFVVGVIAIGVRLVPRPTGRRRVPRVWGLLVAGLLVAGIATQIIGLANLS